MKLQNIKKLPNTPGVYMFLDGNKKNLYIGKATSLRSRVCSYFDKDIAETRGSHIALMVGQAKEIDFIKTDSVLEALILEVNLIKKYKPRFNTKEKDDKSFNFVVVTKEDFPRILVVRAKELFGGHTLKYDVKYTFGPFPSGTVLRDAMKVIRKIFPFRDKCLPKISKPCFNRQIRLCPGVCTGEISKKEYSKTIRNIKLFFDGKKTVILKKLEREMKEAAKKLEFEKANVIKKTIFDLKHIQDIAIIKNVLYKEPSFIKNEGHIEAYDVAHIAGTSLVGVMTVVENEEARKSRYRKFKIKSFNGVNDTRALKEVLERRLAHSEWQLPKLFVVDGGKAQKNAAEKVLQDAGIKIPVVGVVKDNRHKPKEIIGKRRIIEKNEKEILFANNEAHRFAIRYHRQSRAKKLKN
jgi:excinuclease ABC subunit C